MFTYFESKREKEHEWGGGKRPEERERIPSRLHTVSTEPNMGLKLMHLKIML